MALERQDSQSKERRRQCPTLRSLALIPQTHPTCVRVCVGIFLLLAFSIALVGIITHLLPIHDQKANSNLHLEEFRDYECLGWHTTAGFYPFAVPRLWRFINHFIFRQISLPCNVKVQPDESGYCELKHKKTGKRIRVLPQSFDEEFHGERPDPAFACVMAHQVFKFHTLLKQSPNPPLQEEPLPFASTDAAADNSRGILIYLQPHQLISVYAIVQLLRRDHGCQLPIELWIHGGEDDLHPSMLEDPVWLALMQLPDVGYRMHWNYQYERLGNVPYSIAYTRFEEVLVLSTTNFPLQDPTFLFDDESYQSTGALFWKDLVSPASKASTIKQPIFWELLDLPPDSPHRKEWEMDASSMLINRRTSSIPLQWMLFLSKGPWFPLLEIFRAMQGNKDLYRFAWHLAQKPFSFVETPPALAVSSAKEHCTQTLIQHAPNSGDALFVHLRGDFGNFTTQQHTVWDHGEYLTNPDQNLGIHWESDKPCYRARRGVEQKKALSGLAQLETKVRQYAEEAVALRKDAKTSAKR